MDKYFALTYKFFNSAMNLVDYLEKSSFSLIQLLEDTPAENEVEELKRRDYENLLKRINTRSKTIKTDLLSTIEKQIYLLDQKQVPTEWFNIINTELESLNQVAGEIFESTHYVDKDGRLQQR